MNILPNGAWDTRTDDRHVFDRSLCDGIVEYALKNGDHQYSTAYDFGCGMGLYTEALNASGIRTLGFDGNPNTPFLTGGLCSVRDLSVEFQIRPVDFVLSLEIGEHIPRQFESTFLDNLVNHAHKTVMLSWAVPDQKGDGHVNCRDNAHVVREMRQRGFWHDDLAGRKLRRKATNAHWFRDTLMVFHRR